MKNLRGNSPAENAHPPALRIGNYTTSMPAAAKQSGNA